VGHGQPVQPPHLHALPWYEVYTQSPELVVFDLQASGPWEFLLSDERVTNRESTPQLLSSEWKRPLHGLSCSVRFSPKDRVSRSDHPVSILHPINAASGKGEWHSLETLEFGFALIEGRPSGHLRVRHAPSSVVSETDDIGECLQEEQT